MKAYKKIMIIAVALLAAILLATLCACDPEAQTAEPTPEHTHTFAEVWTHNDEYHWHAATCGHTDETKDKAKHQLAWETTTPATCDAKGVQTGSCVCGYSETRSIDFAEHSWGKWTSNDDKTHTRTCSNNSAHTETKSCSFDSVVTPPSCKAQGYTTYTCKDCGYSYTSDPTPKTDHIYDSDGTCTECGAPDPSQSAEVSDAEILKTLKANYATPLLQDYYDRGYDVEIKDWFISENTAGKITGIEFICFWKRTATSYWIRLYSLTFNAPFSKSEFVNPEQSATYVLNNATKNLVHDINYDPTIQEVNAELTDAIFEALGVEDTGAERIIIDQGGGMGDSELKEYREFKIIEITNSIIKEFIVRIKDSNDTLINNLGKNLFHELVDSRKTVKIEGTKLVPEI